MKHQLLILSIFFHVSIFSQGSMSFTEMKIPKPYLKDTTVLNFNVSQPYYANLNNDEKEFYYWINYSRVDTRRFIDSAVIPITKIYPQLRGDNLESLKKDMIKTGNLPFLSLNLILCKMAKKHSLDITSHQAKPSHNSTNGETFADRFKYSGFNRCGGENISYGNSETLFHLVLLYIDINVPELGHRKALLNPSFLQTGIGNSFYKDSSMFIVEDFSCAQN